MNERFPYTLSAKVIQLDSNGDPKTDDNGDALYSDYIFHKVVSDSAGFCTDYEGNILTEDSDTIPFGYRGNSKDVSERDVEVETRQIATPLFIGDMPSGTLLFLQDLDGLHRGVVVRKGNTNFGTDIWYNDARN